MFKLEFDPRNTLLAAAMGKGLLEYVALVSNAQGKAPAPAPDGTTTGRTDGTTESQSNTPADINVETDGNMQKLAEVIRTDARPDNTAPTTASDAQMAAIAKVDLNGVAFCDLHCAKAAKPFYASGKYSGQWKKKHGVTDAAYAAWYAGELLVAQGTAAASAGTDETVNTAGAFAAENTPAGPTAPADFGQFMKWVSEMQVAERLTQADVNNAYAVCGVTMADMMAPNTPDVIAANVVTLHTNLAVLVG